MRRRDFLVLAGAAGTAMTFSRVAQAQAAKVPRIAVLSLTLPQDAQLLEALRQGLTDYGYMEGKNAILESFTAAATSDLAAEAAKAVAARPDLLLAYNAPAALAAQGATVRRTSTPKFSGVGSPPTTPSAAPRRNGSVPFT